MTTSPFRHYAILGAAFIALCGLLPVPSAQAQQMGRNPWESQVLNSPLALNRAVAIEQKEEGGLTSRISTITTDNSTTITATSAENFTEVLTNCGNDAACAVDATLNRSGTGGGQSANTTTNP